MRIALPTFGAASSMAIGAVSSPLAAAVTRDATRLYALSTDSFLAALSVFATSKAAISPVI
jgi:hypothetical protein